MTVTTLTLIMFCSNMVYADVFKRKIKLLGQTHHS